jgi:hypothetical protein
VSASELAIVAALDLFEAGDQEGAVNVLLGALEDGPSDRPHCCHYCPAAFEWPGLRDHHECASHTEAQAAA